MASKIIDSSFLNAVNKPLEDYCSDLENLSKAYEQTDLKELKKRHKEIEGFVKETKYVLDEINKLKKQDDSDENKSLLKFNIVKMIKIQASYLMHQAVASKMILEQNSKQYLKSLNNSVKLIQYLVDKFSKIKTPFIELSLMQKLMWRMAVTPGRGYVSVPKSSSTNELSKAILGNAKIIKDNAEVLLYYFTDNGRKLHNKFRDKKQRPQSSKIREAGERIKKCLDKLDYRTRS